MIALYVSWNGMDVHKERMYGTNGQQQKKIVFVRIEYDDRFLCYIKRCSKIHHLIKLNPFKLDLG